MPSPKTTIRGGTSSAPRSGSGRCMGQLPKSWYPFVRLEAVTMPDTLAGYDEWKLTEPPSPADRPESEYDREQRWAHFEREVLDFAGHEPEGFAAVLRAVARCISDQRDLFK
jgi:hypothetical protein